MMDNIMHAITIECERQHVGADRRWYLLEAYEAAWKLCREGMLPTLDTTLELAGILEPSNRGKLRTVPVTFSNGGAGAPATEVGPALERLFEIFTEVFSNTAPQDREALVDEFIYSFEKIHPLTDGNGRLGWLLRVWLLDQFENPQPLPDYFNQN